MATLGDYISIKHGYAFKGDGITTEDNGVVLVTPGNFATGGGFKEEKCKFFSDQYSSDFVLSPGDLIVTMTDLSKEMDTLGYSALVPKSNRVYLHNQRIGLISINREGLDKQYLYWFMRSRDYQRTIAGGASGTTVHHTSPSRICEVQINFPDLLTQKKIARLLDSLEDKIQNNSKINKNLLEQAQSIFTQEFLMFDRIPDSWQESSLLGIADYLNGLAMQKYRPKDDEQGLPVLKIKELRQGSCDFNSELCSPSIKPEYIVHDGDVIFSWSGSLLVDLWCGGTCGLNQHLFKVTSSTYDKWFYYAWTNHHLQKFAAIAADMATTMGHIKREELSKVEVLIPSQSDYDRIGGLLAPLYGLVIANRIENHKLASLRDALLPQLMSGQLDVSEVSL